MKLSSTPLYLSIIVLAAALFYSVLQVHELRDTVELMSKTIHEQNLKLELQQKQLDFREYFAYPSIYINRAKTKDGAVWAQCGNVLQKPRSMGEADNVLSLQFSACGEQSGIDDKVDAQ